MGFSSPRDATGTSDGNNNPTVWGILSALPIKNESHYFLYIF